MTTEYLHLLLGPVLTHVFPVAALALLAALLCRSPAAIRLSLVLLVVSGAAVWFTVHSGDASFDRVKAMSYRSGVEWLEVHRWRADHFAWTFYAAAALALLALLAPQSRARLRGALRILALVAALGASVAGAYIAYAGGRVRHSEIRQNERPTPAQLQAAEKDS